MPETKQITFTHKEVAEALITYAGLDEGEWGIYVEFGIVGANIEPPGGELTPAAIVPLMKLGLQRFPEKNSLTADAAALSKQTKRPQRQRRG